METQGDDSSANQRVIAEALVNFLSAFVSSMLPLFRRAYRYLSREDETTLKHLYETDSIIRACIPVGSAQVIKRTIPGGYASRSR